MEMLRPSLRLLDERTFLAFAEHPLLQAECSGELWIGRFARARCEDRQLAHRHAGHDFFRRLTVDLRKPRLNMSSL